MEKLTVSQLTEISRTFWNPNLHYPVHKIMACLYLEPDKQVQALPHPIFLRYVLILSSHLRLGLTQGLFPSDIPIKTLYDPFSVHLITLTIWRVAQLMKLPITQPPATSCYFFCLGSKYPPFSVPYSGRPSANILAIL